MSVTIVKYGGSSQKSIDDIAMHATVTRDFLGKGNRVITVVSGPGDITDRVERAIDGKESEIDPASIFAPWETLYEQAGSPKELVEIRDRIYGNFKDSIRTTLPQVRSIEEMGAVHAIKAQLLLGPEQLQAALVNHVYIEGGLDSLCINFDEGYPIIVKGYPLNSNVDLQETRIESQRVLSETKAEVIIQPGFGGLDGKVGKTLGKGGSDAVAFAFYDTSYL